MLREHQQLEWKEAWRDERLKWVCAFANAAFDKAHLRVVRRATPQVTPRVNPQVTTQVTTEVSPQLALMQTLTQPLTRRELQAALRLKNNDHFRKAYLLPALSEGLIEMTLPDKPNSRLQRYRLTPAGRARLQALKPPEQP